MGVLHHLDITTAREEMWRILRPSGVIVLKEPIASPKPMPGLRSFLPAGKDISPYEHPLTREELASMVGRFRVSGIRHSRLPFVPLITVLFLQRRPLLCALVTGSCSVADGSKSLPRRLP